MLINFGTLPQLPGFDPRFSYIITDWQEDSFPDCDTGEYKFYYHCQCSGFWEKKFVASVPGVMSEDDIKKNQGEQLVRLYKSLYSNLVNACYDSVLEKLGYEPYGPRSLHYS